jgi:hypothetical protein
VYIEAGAAWGFGRGDVRLGALGAYEETYYQSSESIFVLAQAHWYLGTVYAIGTSLGLGYASLSPKNGYNADSGGAGDLLWYGTPMLLRLGERSNVEVALHVGLLQSFATGETDPFLAASVGVATW